MGKTLCDWSKQDRLKRLSEYTGIVKKPKFMCETCGRVAIKKKFLCDAYKLPKETPVPNQPESS
jgi:hypothetical protein